jgi:hypothetical protein
MREWLTNIRRRLWNKRLKLWWYRLYVRQDEFHCSLNTDVEAMFVMDSEEIQRYFKDIQRRRTIAHRRDLHREDKRHKPQSYSDRVRVFFTEIPEPAVEEKPDRLICLD